MVDDRNKKNERIQLAKKIGMIAAGLLFFYLLIGFWVVPPLFEKADVAAKQIQLKPFQIKPAPNGDGWRRQCLLKLS